MKKAELLRLLEGIPEDVEIVVGDPDYRRFFEPHLHTSKVKRLFMLAIFNPLDNTNWREYFDDETTATRRRRETIEHGWEPQSVRTILCLNI